MRKTALRFRKAEMKKLTGFAWFLLACLFFLLFSLVSSVPRVVLKNERGELLFSFLLFPGDYFETEYIHSVQLCPVIDRYYVFNRTLFLWEERTQSTGAGLPFEAPVRGRFVNSDSWYRYIGGGRLFGRLYIRIGNEEFGRNVLRLPDKTEINLFELFPGKRLVLQID